MTRQIRFDVRELAAGTRTPQGFLSLGGNLTRTGVLVYRRADGTEFRELRPASEVFKADSLASMNLAPVTDRHPRGLVNPDNVRKVQVGITTNPHQDGRFLAADLVIQDRRMIEKIERGDARELSAGYTCNVEHTPGVHNGEHYDGIQRDIEYNHVALGPRDWGRAGPEVSLHLDSADADANAFAWSVDRADRSDTIRDHKETDTMETKTIRIDGADITIDASHATFVEKALAERDGKIAEQTARADETQGKVDALTTEVGELKEKLDAATDPATIANQVAARVELEKAARKILGSEEKLDGKTDRDVKVLVLKSQDEKFDATDRSDDYINGRFEAIVASAPERNTSRDDARRAILRSQGKGPDAKGEVKIDSANAAKIANREKAAEMGTGPLRVSLNR